MGQRGLWDAGGGGACRPLAPGVAGGAGIRVRSTVNTQGGKTLAFGPAHMLREAKKSTQELETYIWLV